MALSWKEGEAEIKDALAQIATPKGTSATRVKAASAVCMRLIKDYKRVVHAIETMMWKSEHPLGFLFVIDAVIRQSQAKYGVEKDVLAARFSKHLSHTISAVKHLPPDAKDQAHRIVHDWAARRVYSRDDITKAGGAEFLATPPPPPAASTSTAPPLNSDAEKEKLAMLLDNIKRMKQQREEKNHDSRAPSGSPPSHAPSSSSYAAVPPSQSSYSSYAPQSQTSAPSNGPRYGQPSSPRRDSPRSSRGRSRSRSPRRTRMRSRSRSPVRDSGSRRRPDPVQPPPQQQSFYGEPSSYRQSSPSFNQGPPRGSFGQSASSSSSFQQSPPASSYNQGPPSSSYNQGPSSSSFNQGPPSSSYTQGPSSSSFGQGPPSSGFNQGPPSSSGFNQGPPSSGFNQGGPPPFRQGPPSSAPHQGGSSFGQPSFGGGGGGFTKGVCFDYAQGRCFRGASCRFLHDGPTQQPGEPGARPPRPQLKTRLCMNFPSGNCRYGDRCTFAHGETQLGSAVETSSSSMPPRSSPHAPSTYGPPPTKVAEYPPYTSNNTSIGAAITSSSLAQSQSSGSPKRVRQSRWGAKPAVTEAPPAPVPVPVVAPVVAPVKHFEEEEPAPAPEFTLEYDDDE
ncbi:hypothetical protein SDRG_14884 [Saprolegnia diclina VS20]|uniref:C3H1-type domain-containing protein n=1 Tax=Saprolegnia diclina (strain VS20) TaxID=1156394 RepID=T0RCD4_SAPDV|nr:hypothetical protein SDRG_14884 [Saprolegnia diclina VS20]EQC27262.1 hypothetical protein SDRG_14884 [Saprolegnia diclina VS20]|eukprot:XP_008619265.1 hypothetical protein SDRG_14884 [Saprolegnia diclina VS20]